MWKLSSSLKNSRRFDWDEYFGNESYVNKENDSTPLFITENDAHYYIFNCQFVECKENGAIKATFRRRSIILLEECTFNRCSSTSAGGSLFFDCQLEGEIVQKRTCYYLSKAEVVYMAFIQQVLDSSDYKNYANETSISYCGESELSGRSTLYIGCGSVVQGCVNSQISGETTKN